jgi:DoxX-like protein
MNAMTSTQRWVGRILSGLAILFLLFDGVMKLVKLSFVVAATTELGYPESTIVPIGLLLLAGVALYVVPRTAVLGAIWLTGFLGGAIATHVRVGSPFFGYTLFPVYVAALLWGGLALRDARVRALVAPE